MFKYLINFIEYQNNNYNYNVNTNLKILLNLII